MRLAELSAALLDEMLRKLRRRAVAGFVVAVCAIAAVIEGTSAARRALEPAAGPVGAPLIVAVTFVIIAAAAVGLLVWAERRAAHATAQARAARGEEDPRAALIAEAVSLGYSLGRDFMKASANGRAPDGPPPHDGDAGDERRPD
jgi:hypothetical protein